MRFGVKLKLFVPFPFHPVPLKITHSAVCNLKRHLPHLALTSMCTPLPFVVSSFSKIIVIIFRIASFTFVFSRSMIINVY